MCYRSSTVNLSDLLSVGLSDYPITRTAYAHTFSGGESAGFLALANQIGSEVQLVQSISHLTLPWPKIMLLMHGNTLARILLKNSQNETKEWQVT